MVVVKDNGIAYWVLYNAYGSYPRYGGQWMFSSLDASLVNSLPEWNELHNVEEGGAVLMVGIS